MRVTFDGKVGRSNDHIGEIPFDSVDWFDLRFEEAGDFRLRIGHGYWWCQRRQLLEFGGGGDESKWFRGCGTDLFDSSRVRIGHGRLRRSFASFGKRWRVAGRGGGHVQLWWCGGKVIAPWPDVGQTGLERSDYGLRLGLLVVGIVA